jgi:hypothetical protein
MARWLINVGFGVALMLAACSTSTGEDRLASLEERIADLESAVAERDAELDQLRADAEATPPLPSPDSVDSAPSDASLCDEYLREAEKAIPNAFDLLDEANSIVLSEYPSASTDERTALQQSENFVLWGRAFQDTLSQIASLSIPSGLEFIHGEFLIALDRGISASAGASLAVEPRAIGGVENRIWVPLSDAERRSKLEQFDAAYGEIFDLVHITGQVCD